MKRPPYTEADLYQPGPPFRLRDICAVTGLSRGAIEAEIRRGLLTGFRVLQRPGSARLFDRADVRAWWDLKRFDMAC